MSRLQEVQQQISAGDTLRDTAGHTYLVRGFVGHGKDAQMAVMRGRDEQERTVYVDVVAAMLQEGNLTVVKHAQRRDA